MSDDLLLSAMHDDTASSDERNDSMEWESSAVGEEGLNSVVADGGDLVPDDPVGYGDFALPEGMEADEQSDQDFRTIAKELGLPRKSAQKLVDFYAQIQARQATYWNDAVKGWKDSVMNDPEIGGTEWTQAKQHIARARDLLGGEEFVDFVESTGIGNHPALLRFCYRAGKLLAEDSPADGRSVSASRSAADVLFGDLRR